LRTFCLECNCLSECVLKTVSSLCLFCTWSCIRMHLVFIGPVLFCMSVAIIQRSHIWPF
jgi:hypothetical protein